MERINFDHQFELFAGEWMRENAALYHNSISRMEEKIPEIYLQWLNTPMAWLGGKTPGGYFADYTDVPLLVSWMLSYFQENIPIPDQLLERITGLGAEAEDALLAILSDDFAPHAARLTAISMLGEMDSQKPMDLYIQWIQKRKATDELADMAAEGLVAMGGKVVAPALAAAQDATPAGKETLTDVLCNFPGHGGIYDLTLSMFLSYPEKRALYASLLGKLQDDRAIPHLLSAMEARELAYLDYIELRNAVEALGGEAPEVRTFDGDPVYESLRRME